MGLVIIFCNSCSPKVISFSARPCTIINQNDSVKFYWKISNGSPILLFSQEDANDDENPGKHYLYYKLVVQKGQKQASSPTLALTILKDSAVDNIVVSTQRHGDSLIGLGNKDSLEWGHKFILNGISTVLNRKLFIQHLQKNTEIIGAGSLSTQLNGLPNSGEWYISTLLTDAEKRDTTLIPAKLKIKTFLLHQKT